MKAGSFAAAEAVLVGTVGRVENQTAKREHGKDYVAGQTAYVPAELQTNVIRLEINTDYKDLELKFPFPYCAKE